MVEVVNGFYALLKNPRIYELVQRAMGADEGRRNFAQRYVKAKPGDRVLDIGCGPADILAHLPSVEYFGWEPNAQYVDQARRTYGKRGDFRVGFFSEIDAAKLEPFDITILSAVLHHLDDEQAVKLFSILRSVVKPGGRVVSIDNVYVAKQNPIARLLISLDRGRNVRTADGYKSLAQVSFRTTEGHIFHKAFPPYSYFVMIAS
jgi:SAM-dependent methyltransferase